MEEHRFACPTHVREFTRYRAHVDFSGDDATAACPAGSTTARAHSPAPAGAESDSPSPRPDPRVAR